MPVEKLKKFLDENQIKFTICSHSTAYTAQEIAAKTHISGDIFAKTVMIKIDGKLAMAILPASYHIDIDLLKKQIGAKNLRLAYESEFKDIFPNCDVGSMPPFGNLWDLGVFVAESIAYSDEIAFSAGTHNEIMKMNYKDFDRLVKPIKLKYSYKEKVL
jgi:Ala-tRNA(Pro) deacylase